MLGLNNTVSLLLIQKCLFCRYNIVPTYMYYKNVTLNSYYIAIIAYTNEVVTVPWTRMSKNRASDLNNRDRGVRFMIYSIQEYSFASVLRNGSKENNLKFKSSHRGWPDHRIIVQRTPATREVKVSVLRVAGFGRLQCKSWFVFLK